MSELTPTQKATAVDRIAARREGFIVLGEDYSFGVLSRPENPQDLTPEQRKEQTVWGLVSWNEDKLGDAPTEEEIAAEAVKGVIPESVTPRQIRLALIDRGVMPSQITQMLNATEDETLREKSLAEWEFASSVKRDHSLIAQLAAVLEFGEEDVDNVFREAKAIGA